MNNEKLEILHIFKKVAGYLFLKFLPKGRTLIGGRALRGERLLSFRFNVLQLYFG